jgi:protein TonB
MKKLKGLKISASLSLGIHLLIFFLFSILFPNLDLTPSPPHFDPLEVSITKLFIKPQPKMVSAQKPFLKQDIPNSNKEIENSIKEEMIVEEEKKEEEPIVARIPPSPPSIPPESESFEFSNSIQEDIRMVSLRDSSDSKIEDRFEEESHKKSVPQLPISAVPSEGIKKNPSPPEKEVRLIYPKYVENPKPIYPREARKKGYEGEVLLRVEVLPNGRVGQIEIRRSSGYEILDRSAMETIKQWRFIPAQKGEDRVTFWVNIPIKFQLQ